MSKEWQEYFAALRTYQRQLNEYYWELIEWAMFNSSAKDGGDEGSDPPTPPTPPKPPGS